MASAEAWLATAETCQYDPGTASTGGAAGGLAATVGAAAAGAVDCPPRSGCVKGCGGVSGPEGTPPPCAASAGVPPGSDGVAPGAPPAAGACETGCGRVSGVCDAAPAEDAVSVCNLAEGEEFRPTI